MGLLEKALVVDAGSSFYPNIHKMIKVLESEQLGLDFPSSLFSHLKRDFQIIKGALFLPETDSHFVPWAETGFDRTTSRRIRIPPSIIKEIQLWDTFNIMELSGTKLEIMRDFFSFREFSVTEKVLIAPILSEKKIIAVLFITDSEILSSPQDEVIIFFETLSREAGPLLLRKRESVLNKLDTIAVKEENPETAINHYIEQMNDKKFLLVSVELIEFIKSIKESDPDSITFRIKQDIVRLIKTLISDKGKVIDTGGSTILILLKGEKDKEAELFVHQIGLSLGYFYKQNIRDFKPDYSIKTYPADGITAEKLLDEILKK